MRRSLALPWAKTQWCAHTAWSRPPQRPLDACVSTSSQQQSARGEAAPEVSRAARLHVGAGASALGGRVEQRARCECVAGQFVIAETYDHLGEALIGLDGCKRLGLPAMVTFASVQPTRKYELRLRRGVHDPRARGGDGRRPQLVPEGPRP